MHMRPSKVLQKLRAGNAVSCVKMNLSDSRAVEIAALAGFDCVWADMEHVPNDLCVVERQVLAAKTHGVDTMVRVSRGGYSDYVRPLELDAAGIMVPHVMGVEDARRVVKMARFHPVGLRPVDGGNADGAFCAVEFNDYLAEANRERFLIVQIEDWEPLAELDEIAALDGVDMLFFGPADFSQSIGAPGQWNHPAIADGRKRVAEAALRHGKFAGTVGGTANLPELLELGYRFLSVGADVVGLGQYFRGLVSQFAKICGE